MRSESRKVTGTWPVSPHLRKYTRLYRRGASTGTPRIGWLFAAGVELADGVVSADSDQKHQDRNHTNRKKKITTNVPIIANLAGDARNLPRML